MGSAHQVRGYTLREFLAQGGMAELFLAQPHDPARSDQIVVVKRVLPQFVQDQQFARMFAREASLASMLKHPNIVEVFDDQGATEAECFFAMEYVHGPDLNMLLKELKARARPVPLEHALEIAMGMCLGLHHAHEYCGDDGQLLSIVHRDVSPSNVMIGDDGIVKITDFGVAKALALTSFTQAGTRKGKLSYMSPEQAVADPVDRRTDIFAIGTVLFEMTTLQRMFGGENELAIMHKLLFRERPRPSAIRHDYPPELEGIVLKAVAQKPDDRFDTAMDMFHALQDFAQRRRLLTTADHLVRWVGSVIPPKPHPGQDPTIFTRHAHATVVPIARDTVVAQDVQPTVSDSAVGADATVLDGGGPRAVAGQLQSVPATTVQPASSVPQIATPTGPTFAAATPSPVHVPAPGTNPSIGRRPAETRSSTLPAIAIVAGALAVGAVILAAALWYADARKRSAPTTTSEPPKAQSAPSAEPVAAPAPEPTPELPPGIVNPDPPAPLVQPEPVVEPEDPVEIDEEPTETPAAAPDPAASTPRRTKKRRNKPKPEPVPEPEPQPKPTPPTPSSSLDELFPSQ